MLPVWVFRSCWLRMYGKMWNCWLAYNAKEEHYFSSHSLIYILWRKAVGSQGDLWTLGHWILFCSYYQNLTQYKTVVDPADGVEKNVGWVAVGSHSLGRSSWAINRGQRNYVNYHLSVILAPMVDEKGMTYYQRCRFTSYCYSSEESVWSYGSLTIQASMN